jgi:hypothetical protein
LCSLALSSEAFTKAPFSYFTARTFPAIGVRFTCTSNTFRKIAMRVAGPWSQSGSSTGSTERTRPSPADTIAPSADGIARSGFRKNQTQKAARRSATDAAMPKPAEPVIAASARAVPMKGHPSRMMKG